jgi:hypothetical protein
VLTAEHARQLSDEFAPRFSSPEAYDASWKRCWDTLRKPSEAQARKWLEEDLERDSIMAGGLTPREPLLPVRQTFEIGDCCHCGGKRYLRREDVPVGHPEFGRIFPCEFCAETHDKTACAVCRTARFFTGYFGPETATVPADWQPGMPIAADWQPLHGGHR